MNTQSARVRLAVAIGVLFLVICTIVTMSQRPTVTIRSNGVEASLEYNRITGGRYEACQGGPGEELPAGATDIRLSLDSVLGPPVKVRLLQGNRLLTYGERGAGWTAADVTVPLRPLSHEVRGVSICFEFFARDESVGLTGERLTGAPNPTEGALKVEYVKSGGSSWWSLIPSVASNLASIRVWSGSLTAPLLAALMGLVIAAVCGAALRLSR